MRGGTLEGLYLSQTPMPSILLGVALALMSYSALMFVGAMIVGAVVFQALFQAHYLPLALVFLLVGLPPLYGLALLYGALVLRIKETDAFFTAYSMAGYLINGRLYSHHSFSARLESGRLALSAGLAGQQLERGVAQRAISERPLANRHRCIAPFQHTGPRIGLLGLWAG